MQSRSDSSGPFGLAIDKETVHGPAQIIVVVLD